METYVSSRHKEHPDPPSTSIQRAAESAVMPSILVVDGDRAMTRFCADLFKKKYRVVVSLSGRQALRLLKHADDRTGLVLLEIKLRDISGLDVLKEIKRRHSEIPVLVITGYGDEGVAVKAFRYGARDYLKKPFSYDELLERVEFCLSLTQTEATRRAGIYWNGEENRPRRRLPLADIATGQHLKIQKALQFIDDNFASNIGLAHTAKKASMSPFHFSRAFKKNAAVTFQEYLTKRRVEKAKELLQNTCRPITDIALTVGYSDPNNLTRNFRKHTGLTPSGFRNEQKRVGPHIS
jgi:two-component system response regulator YesN